MSGKSLSAPSGTESAFHPQILFFDAMAVFRFLQVTDLHISVVPDDEIGELAVWLSHQTVNPSRARKPVLEAVAEFVTENQTGIDAILLSGDLADDGERRNLEAALAFVEAPADPAGSCFREDGFPTLATVNRKRTEFFVLPGNHDRFRGIRRRPGGADFDDVFKTLWTKGIGGVQSLLLEKSDGTIGLIGADFCLQASGAPLSTHWGRGAVNQNTLSALEAETNLLQKQNDGIGIVWVLHFPPLLDVEASLKLESAKDALDRARSLGVRYVLAGHLHRNQQVNYNGVEVICTGSAASEYREDYGNWIRLLEFDVRPANIKVVQSLFRYDARDGGFVPDLNLEI